MGPYQGYSENVVSSHLDFSSDLFDPTKALLSREIFLPYPKSKTYNNLAEYYTHTFGSKTANLSAKDPSGRRVSSKKSKKEPDLLQRNYAWFYATLGIEHESDTEKTDYCKSKAKVSKVGDKVVTDKKNFESSNKHCQQNPSAKQVYPALRSERTLKINVDMRRTQAKFSKKKCTNDDPNDKVGKKEVSTPEMSAFQLAKLASDNIEVARKLSEDNCSALLCTESNLINSESPSVVSNNSEVLGKKELSVEDHDKVLISDIDDCRMNIKNVINDSENSLSKDKMLLQLAKKARCKLHSGLSQNESLKSSPGKTPTESEQKVTHDHSVQMKNLSDKIGTLSEDFHFVGKNSTSVSQSKNASTSKSLEQEKYLYNAKDKYLKKSEHENYPFACSSETPKRPGHENSDRNILKSKENIHADNGTLKVSIKRNLISVRSSREKNRDPVSKHKARNSVSNDRIKNLVLKDRNKNMVSKDKNKNLVFEKKKLESMAKHESVLQFLGFKKLHRYKIPHKKTYADYRRSRRF